jgi:hypothetical protein
MSEKKRILLAELKPRIPQAAVPTTWNPSDHDLSVSLSNGNLTATKTTTDASAWGCVRGTLGVLVGKYYWETTFSYTGTGDLAVGIAPSTRSLTLEPGVGSGQGTIGVKKDGGVRVGGSPLANIGALSSGDTVCHYLDGDALTYSVRRNDGDWYTIDLLSILGYDGINKQAFPIVGFLRPSSSTAACTANFGQSAFAYELPLDAGPIAEFPAPEETTVYVASDVFNTGSSDTPANTEYLARIVGDEDVEVDRDVSCSVWGGQTQARPWRMSLVNADGVLDDWYKWEWRDAKARLLAGYEGDALADFTPWLTGLVDNVSVGDRRRFVLNGADLLARLDRSIQTDIYPGDQANAQLAGKGKPIVLGRPLYCEASLLDTADTARDYQLADGFTDGTIADQLTEITSIYDKGDLFSGPDDPYTAHNPMTLANGGAFTTWGGTPSVPSGWTAITTFGASNDRFSNSLSACRCQSSGQMLTAMYFNVATLTAGYRYTISFTVGTVTTPGNILFRTAGLPGGPSNDVVVAITVTGSVSVTIDVPVTSVMQIVLGSYGAVDIVLDSMTVSSVQVIDWTYYDDDSNRIGFHLANKPEGKVVANPVGPKTGSTVIEYLPELFEYLLARAWDAYGDSVSQDVDWDAIDALDAKAHYRMAKFIGGGDTSILSVMREIMGGLLGDVFIDLDGSLSVCRVEAPARGQTDIILDETNCKSITRTVDDATGLSLQLAGRMNNSPHTDSDIATSVSLALRNELKAKWGCIRQGAAPLNPGNNTPVAGAYMHAINAKPTETLLQESVDLVAEANRRATLWRRLRMFYDVEAVLSASDAETLRPGDTVRVVWPWIDDLNGGQSMWVKRIRSGFFRRNVSLRLWAPAPV